MEENMAERLPWVSSTPEVIPKALNYPQRRSFEQGMRDAESAPAERRKLRRAKQYDIPGTPASKACAAAIGQDK